MDEKSATSMVMLGDMGSVAVYGPHDALGAEAASSHFEGKTSCS